MALILCRNITQAVVTEVSWSLRLIFRMTGNSLIIGWHKKNTTDQNGLMGHLNSQRGN